MTEIVKLMCSVICLQGFFVWFGVLWYWGFLFFLVLFWGFVGFFFVFAKQN